MNDDKIENLWAWFSKNEQRIRDYIGNESAIERDYIVEHLDNLILDLGVFRWEIGPGFNKEWFLTISPNGDKDLMEISKNIIAAAPDLAEWEYNFSRPAKDWDLKFNLYDENMTEQEVNASSWQFVALQNADGLIDLILQANNIGHLDSDTARTAADLVVVNEIGEETKILNILSINIVDQLEKSHDARKTEIGHLKKYLKEIGVKP